MEEILNKATELGRLICNTEAAVNFHEIENRVALDPDASLLLKKYNDIAEMIRLKQESGFDIESFEADDFSQITEAVSSNTLLREYIRSRNRYMDMLVRINNELTI